MPFGDPGGNYASGGAVNQGGPSGPNSPGNMGNMVAVAAPAAAMSIPLMATATPIKYPPRAPCCLDGSPIMTARSS